MTRFAVLLVLALLAISLSTLDAQKPIKPVKKEISVEDVKFAVFERDLTEPNEYNTVKPNEKLSKTFQADQHRKIHLKFTVKDKKANAAINVHQAFAVFINTQTNAEVIYVAEPDKTTKAYIVELDLKTHHKDFNGVSGKYTLRLILGDAAVSNPVDWTIAEVTITVPSVEPTPQPKSKQIGYEKLPEIKHTFREPEQQPPASVSHVFGALCAAPFLILFVLWLRVGLNFGNAKFSLWALGFHLGLGAIFGLYFMYWQQLNMFQTLQYLSVVGVVTFVCGNRLLHSFNDDKKQKAE